MDPITGLTLKIKRKEEEQGEKTTFSGTGNSFSADSALNLEIRANAAKWIWREKIRKNRDETCFFLFVVIFFIYCLNGYGSSSSSFHTRTIMNAQIVFFLSYFFSPSACSDVSKRITDSFFGGESVSIRKKEKRGEREGKSFQSKSISLWNRRREEKEIN